MSIYLGDVSLPWERPKTPEAWGGESKQSINYRLIQEFYITNQEEDKRTSFDNTFRIENLYNENGSRGDGKYADDSEYVECFRFYDALEDNKQYLMNTLDIESDEYDSMCCVALAIASQETGMGHEDGYQEEQVKNMFDSFGNFFTTITRKAGIWLFSDNSQSSGLTQIKIHDQFQNVFQDWDISALRQRGVKVDGKLSDNLEIPEVAAIATIGVLKTIMDNFDEYKATLDRKHAEMAKNFDLQGITPAEAEQKGFDYLSDMYTFFESASKEDKAEIQDALCQWLKSTDGSTKKNKSDSGNYYTEEVQMERLQKVFGDKIKLNMDSLQYIKFALCSEDCQMDVTEYCAYAWNNGIEDWGMKPDNLMSGKIGAIFRDSDNMAKNGKEDNVNNNYVGSVISLIERYAQQGSSFNPYWAVEDHLDDYVEEYIKSYEWNNR